MRKSLSLALCGVLLMTQPVVLNAAQKAAVKSLTINKSKLSMNVGDTFALKATSGSTKLNSNQVAYSSTDPLAADVDANGKIEATGAGKTTITVKSKTDSKVVAKCVVDVKKPKPITISLIVGASNTPTKDNVLYKEIKKRLNVTFKISYFVGSEDEKRGVMIASGDYPDIIGSNQKLIDAKAEIPLEPLIEKYAPHIKQHMYPYYKQLMDPKDKHLYYMISYGRVYGKATTLDPMGTGFFIQKAVLKEFGYPKIKTMDEYFDLIKKYKAKHPKIDGKPTIGYIIENYDWKNFGLVNPPQFLAGYPNDGNVMVNQKTYKAQIFANKDVMKKFIKKVNEVNAEGLFDKESFLLNHDQYIAKLSAGNVLGFCDQKWNYQSANQSLYNQGKIERQYVGMALTFDKNTKPWYIDAPALNISNGWAITKSCKNPTRVIKTFDTLLTEAWQKRIQWGEKGKDYLVDKNGMFYRTDAMRKAENDIKTWAPKHSIDDVFGNAPKIEGQYSDGNVASPGVSKTEFYAGLNSYDKKFLDGYGYKCWADFFGDTPASNPPYYPCWNIPLDTKGIPNIAITKLKDLQMQELPKIIMAKPSSFESLWKSYLSKFKDIPVKEYETEINKQIQWRIKNWH